MDGGTAQAAIDGGAVADRPTRPAYAEQALFAHSPFNLWITTAGLYAVSVGLFGLAVWVDGLPWIVHDQIGAATLSREARLGLTLPLIGCVSLALQRFSWTREVADRDNFQRALRPGATWETDFSLRRLRAMAIAGALIGTAIMAAITPWRGPLHLATLLWFAATSAGLSALFLRGVELTRASSRQARLVIRDGLQIDLLRIERLYPWGRAAARTSLVWFAVSAAALLLVVDNGLGVFTIALMLGCAGMGAWVFVSTLTLVHNRIRTVKAEELETLRGEIAETRERLDIDSAAPPRLQALLAYEKRIDDAPEWPFDQTILVRLGASSLILAIPWFGQAVAGVVVENVSKVMR